MSTLINIESLETNSGVNLIFLISSYIWQYFRQRSLLFQSKFALLSEMGPKKNNRAEEETDKLTRIAIVSTDKCKPKRCRQECKKSCPVVRMGKLCIEVTPNDKYVTLSLSASLHFLSCLQDCFHIWGALYWMWYLREKMSVWSRDDHKPSLQPREPHHPPLLSEQLQAAQTAHPQTWRGVGTRGNKRNWEIHSSENSCWETEAQPG